MLLFIVAILKIDNGRVVGTDKTLACHFVGHGEKPEKSPCLLSPLCLVDTNQTYLNEYV